MCVCLHQVVACDVGLACVKQRSRRCDLAELPLDARLPLAAELESLVQDVRRLWSLRSRKCMDTGEGGSLSKRSEGLVALISGGIEDE